MKTQSILDCGGKRSATPLSDATGAVEKLRRRGALPEHSKTLRHFILLFCFIVLHSSFCLRASGQSYSIDWFKVAGGGGTSTGGIYSVSGTIGQQDAGGPMTGGNFSLTGGFWALVSVVQTAGAPMLYISRAANSLTVYWQNTGSWTLQQNTNVAISSGWSASSGVTTSNGTNSLTLANPSGNLFFKLKGN